MSEALNAWKANPVVLSGPENYNEWKNTVMLIAAAKGLKPFESPWAYPVSNEKDAEFVMLLYASVSADLKKELQKMGWAYSCTSDVTLTSIDKCMKRNRDVAADVKASEEFFSLDRANFATLKDYLIKAELL